MITVSCNFSPMSKLNGVLFKLPFRLGHGWVISSPMKRLMWFPIPALISLKLSSCQYIRQHSIKNISLSHVCLSGLRIYKIGMRYWAYYGAWYPSSKQVGTLNINISEIIIIIMNSGYGYKHSWKCYVVEISDENKSLCLFPGIVINWPILI